MQLAGPIGCQHHEWRLISLDRADFGNRHLEISQDLEQEGLELIISPIDLVD